MWSGSADGSDTHSTFASLAETICWTLNKHSSTKETIGELASELMDKTLNELMGELMKHAA